MWVNPADGSTAPNARGRNTDPNDDYGHGTHVRARFGAMGNNGLGIVGICWRVQIMALKFLDSTGNGTIPTLWPAWTYARTHGAKVVKRELGATFFTVQALTTPLPPCVMADIVFVAAAAIPAPTTTPPRCIRPVTGPGQRRGCGRD